MQEQLPLTAPLVLCACTCSLCCTASLPGCREAGLRTLRSSSSGVSEAAGGDPAPSHCLVRGRKRVAGRRCGTRLCSDLCIVAAPAAGTYPCHIDCVKGNNAIVIYDAANCWVNNVRALTGRTRGRWGQWRFCAACCRRLRSGQRTQACCWLPGRVQIKVTDADMGVLVSGVDLVTVSGVTTTFTKLR